MEFTNWTKWQNRNELANNKYPGVYAIALSDMDINGSQFNWIKEIIYIGMTNSNGGLLSRLARFDHTLRGGKGHVGAKHFLLKYPNASELISSLYVAVKSFECDTRINSVKDLLVMGKVAECEYIAFGEYVRRFGYLPELNK